jgi:23S rRNA pseudouridine955/2504/2580 synthase
MAQRTGRGGARGGAGQGTGGRKPPAGRERQPFAREGAPAGRDGPARGRPKSAGDGPGRSKAASGPKPPGVGRTRRPPIKAGNSTAQLARHAEAADAVAKAPRAPTKASIRAAAQETLETGVQTLVVEPDEAEMRVDRFLTARFPQLAFTHIQRIVRKGELRIDGKRAKPNERLQPGQKIRIPPLKLDAPRPVSARSVKEGEETVAFLQSITLYEDKDVLVINKPAGLAVQGGSGTTRHVDGMLEALTDEKGERARLVHRLDKDTAGCLVIAKTRFAATTMAKSFRSRTTRKVYWALCVGIPRVRQGRISTYLAREEIADADARMRVAQHGDDGASHALTYYAVVDQAGQKLSWLSLKPVTGRTHQLRAHAAHIGHPIIGDPKYFDVENWELPGGLQNKLHLLARRIVIPHPRTGRPIDVTAPLPPHMQQSFNLLGFETDRYDPIVDAPED